MSRIPNIVNIYNLSSDLKFWKTPTFLLMAMTACMQVAFAAWMLSTNNFAVEVLNFTGKEIGIQQSIREIPGFLAFTAVYLLRFGREQVWAYISLIVLGVAVCVTGWFPTFTGFMITTLISSMGFHYFETMHQSLTLQWLPKKTAPATMGKILAVGSSVQLLVFGFIFVAGAWLTISFNGIYMITGLITCITAFLMWAIYPMFDTGIVQQKKIILKKRYGLYYALTFLGGARRQIFVVFASFLMVERFGFEIHEVAGVAIANGILTMWLAPKIGQWIIKFGERRMLTIEYIGLIAIFTGYAFVSSWQIAVALYLADHALFAMAVAQKTYFQKIADPEDFAPTASVAFTINHIAAVFIPILFGLIWVYDPSIVFFIGAALAVCSLGLSRLIPFVPEKNNEFIWSQKA